MAYEHVLAAPDRELRGICDFLGAEFQASMTDGIEPRSPKPDRLDIDPLVRRLCDELEERLEAACASLIRS